jgi:hypothetical protein
MSGNIEILGDDFLGGAMTEIVGDDDLSAFLGDDDGGDFDLFGAAPRRVFNMPNNMRLSTREGGQNQVAQLRRAEQLIRQRKAQIAGQVGMDKLVQYGGVVRRRGYSSLRKLPAGFTSPTAVPAGDPVNITVRAVVPIRPDRLMIASVIAPFFELTALTVALDNHMLTPDGVPCELFIPTATGVNEEGTGFFKIPTLDVGTEINMTFVNIDGSAHTLRGAWICTAAV